jgi:hypothetical protein
MKGRAVYEWVLMSTVIGCAKIYPRNGRTSYYVQFLQHQKADTEKFKYLTTETQPQILKNSHEILHFDLVSLGSIIILTSH